MFIDIYFILTFIFNSSPFFVDEDMRINYWCMPEYAPLPCLEDKEDWQVVAWKRLQSLASQVETVREKSFLYHNDMRRPNVRMYDGTPIFIDWDFAEYKREWKLIYITKKALEDFLCCSYGGDSHSLFPGWFKGFVQAEIGSLDGLCDHAETDANFICLDDLCGRLEAHVPAHTPTSDNTHLR
eukprot:GHVR01043694.1.p1 GENE.GHVR01043694.1~~GHVR01043694.1.p1  ORF type:complete len:183 (-),score=26.34 GHVR01043694.1:55-603(-)